MNENDVRRIVREELQKDYGSGAPRVAPHIHDGITNSKIAVGLLSGVNQFSKLGVGQVGQPIAQNLDGSDYSLPIPVIIGHGVGTDSQFNGGKAPNGTLLFFANPAVATQLWVMFDGTWYGFDSAHTI